MGAKSYIRKGNHPKCITVVNDTTSGKLITGINDTGGKFTARVNDAASHVFTKIFVDSGTLVVNLPPVATTQAVIVTGVNSIVGDLLLVLTTRWSTMTIILKIFL